MISTPSQGQQCADADAVEGFALKMLVGQQGGIAVDDELSVLQADERDEQADADTDGGFQRHGDGVEDGLTHIGQGQDDKDDALDKDGQQGHLPAVAHRQYDGVGKVGVQAHAGGQRERVVGHQRHAHRTNERRQRGGNQHGFGVHTGRRQNVGVDRQDVGHRHKGRDTSHDFGFYIRVVLLQVEEFFHDVPPIVKSHILAAPNFSSMRSIFIVNLLGVFVNG